MDNKTESDNEEKFYNIFVSLYYEANGYYKHIVDFTKARNFREAEQNIVGKYYLKEFNNGKEFKLISVSCL